jgi:hypothetical protein
MLDLSVAAEQSATNGTTSTTTSSASGPIPMAHEWVGPGRSTAKPCYLKPVPVAELRPHPALGRLGIGPNVHKVSTLALRGEAAFANPLTVTEEGHIIDGYARWELARRTNRPELLCLVFSVSEEEALIQLLYEQHRSTRLNDFNRIRLSLELEEFLKSRHLAKEQATRATPSSEMTKAPPLDVRKEEARIAGVATGSISNTKYLVKNAAREVVDALSDGNIRIGRARGWLKHSKDGGLYELRRYRTTRAMEKQSKNLLSRPSSTESSGSCHQFDSILGLTLEQMKDLFRQLVSTMPKDCIREILFGVEIP